MSVPRPAMLVAIVMAPGCPACATISASRWWYLAFKTSCRKPRRLSMLDLVEDRLVFLAARLVDEVVLVHAAHRPVGRDHDDLEPVDLEELGLLGLRRARHARELVVHPEVVLDRDGGQGLALLLNRHALLRFHGLVQPLRPAPPVH